MDLRVKTRTSSNASSERSAYRVGLVVGDFPVISETFVINQATGLLDRGHDLAILPMNGQRPPDNPMHHAVKQYDLLSRTYRPFAGSVLIGPFSGHPVDPQADWSLLRRACSLIAQAGMVVPAGRFDIVHCQFATLGLEIQTLRQLGLLQFDKLVVHLRGSDVSRFVQEKGPDVYRALFRSADLLIANCEYFRDRAIALGAPPENVIVIGSAIDCSRFPLVKRERLAGQPRRLISIGRLVEKKGYEFAIRGFALAAKKHPGLQYDIVGEGPLRGELTGLIEELGLESQVHLLGAMTQDRILDRLKAADAMIAVSVRASSGDEDAPVNSLKEGMATGLPIVASRHGGIPELVEDGVHGYLVRERNSEDIAKALVRLLSEPGRWLKMGELGRSKVKKTYDISVVMDKLESSYRNLWASGASPVRSGS